MDENIHIEDLMFRKMSTLGALSWLTMVMDMNTLINKFSVDLAVLQDHSPEIIMEIEPINPDKQSEVFKKIHSDLTRILKTSDLPLNPAITVSENKIIISTKFS